MSARPTPVKQASRVPRIVCGRLKRYTAPAASERPPGAGVSAAEAAAAEGSGSSVGVAEAARANEAARGRTGRLCAHTAALNEPHGRARSSWSRSSPPRMAASRSRGTHPKQVHGRRTFPPPPRACFLCLECVGARTGDIGARDPRGRDIQRGRPGHTHKRTHSNVRHSLRLTHPHSLRRRHLLPAATAPTCARLYYNSHHQPSAERLAPITRAARSACGLSSGQRRRGRRQMPGTARRIRPCPH